MADKLREIIREVYHKAKIGLPISRVLDQATAEIKSLLKNKLPKKKEEIFERGKGWGTPFEIKENKSFNLALTEIEKIWEEM